MEDNNINGDFWNNYYKNTNDNINNNSSFSKFVYDNYINEYNKQNVYLKIADLGSGNCKDSLFFSKKGNLSNAIDINGVLNTSNSNCKLIREDVEHVLKSYKLQTLFDVMYMRWFLNAMPYNKSESIFKYAVNNLKPNGLVCIEVSSLNDIELKKNSKYDENDKSYTTTHKIWKAPRNNKSSSSGSSVRPRWKPPQYSGMPPQPFRGGAWSPLFFPAPPSRSPKSPLEPLEPHKIWLYSIEMCVKLAKDHNCEILYCEEDYFSPNKNTETHDPLLIRIILKKKNLPYFIQSKNYQKYRDILPEKKDLTMRCYKQLEKFNSIIEKFNIKYIAVAGTLLGLNRHGGIIPWDDDIDIGFEQEEWNKLFKILDVLKK
ncbi:MAG: hypothetical protein CMC93_00715, partial [Flavobacteriaceae bacterium]|nr:hypothetical protein [Flavobacteriaceae bacterium]